MVLQGILIAKQHWSSTITGGEKFNARGSLDYRIKRFW